MHMVLCETLYGLVAHAFSGDGLYLTTKAAQCSDPLRCLDGDTVSAPESVRTDHDVFR